MTNLTNNATEQPIIRKIVRTNVLQTDFQSTINIMGTAMCIILITVAVLVVITIFYSNRLVSKRGGVLEKLERILEASSIRSSTRTENSSRAGKEKEGYMSCPGYDGEAV